MTHLTNTWCDVVYGKKSCWETPDFWPIRFQVSMASQWLFHLSLDKATHLVMVTWSSAGQSNSSIFSLSVNLFFCGLYTINSCVIKVLPQLLCCLSHCHMLCQCMVMVAGVQLCLGRKSVDVCDGVCTHIYIVVLFIPVPITGNNRYPRLAWTKGKTLFASFFFISESAINVLEVKNICITSNLCSNNDQKNISFPSVVLKSWNTIPPFRLQLSELKVAIGTWLSQWENC